METENSYTCNELKEITDIVTCAICLDLYENARLLPCTHTFCLNCLRALCEDCNPMQPMRCPQCRELSIPPSTQLEQLPVHEFANQLTDLVREQEGLLDVQG